MTMAAPTGGTLAGQLSAREKASLALIIFAVGAATVIAVIGGNGRFGVALAPILLVSAFYLVCRVPLRWTAAVLLTLLLSLDVSTDAAGLWHTPLVSLGDFLVKNLDLSVGVPGLKVTGLEVILALLLAIWIYRKATGSKIDGPGEVQTAAVLGDFVLVYLASLAFAVANGLLTGGSMAIWQVRQLLHTPLFFFFFRSTLRGPQDQVLLGRIIVFSALVKAGLAAWVKHQAVTLTGGDLAYATNHGDSILFALAIVILLAQLAERTDRRRLILTAVLLPLLLWGTYANNRRLAFVDVAVGLLTLYFFGPPRPWKRAVRRFAIVAAPIAFLYLSAGWNSTSAVFRPVRTLRSLSDTRKDRSTLWRDVENWNISMSMRERPLFGIGMGKEYTEHMKNDDISGYREYRVWPHNSVLGLLLFGGLFAFTGMWALFAVTIFLAIRSVHLAQLPEHRTTALCALCAVLFCVVQAYGDGGAPFTQYRVFTGLALAVTGKLAVSTGAWPTAWR